MPDSSTNPSGNVDQSRPRRLGSLRRRYLLVTLLSTLTIMLLAGLAQHYLENTRTENSARILQRLQVSTILNTTLQLLGDLNDAVDNYLLAPRNKTILEWESSYRQMQALIREIGNTGWVRNNGLSGKIVKIEQNLEHYRNEVRKLFALRRNPIRQLPAFHYARDIMLPLVRNFDSAVSIALQETGEALSRPAQREIYRQLVLVSRSWRLLINEFRMYLINRMGSFSLDALNRQAGGLLTLNREIVRQIDVLLKREDLGFETEDALQMMKRNALAWRRNLLKVLEINRGTGWRMDLVRKAARVMPAYNRLHARLMQLEQQLRDTANQDIDNMTTMANNTIRILWLLSGIIFLLFFAAFLYLDRTIFRSVRQMSQTLRQASHGNDLISLPDTRLEETHDLVAAFNEMRRQIRSRQSALEHQALHDALTGLPNRTLLQDRLQQAIFTARRKGGNLALLIMDLDHFKEINDTLGHQVGDQILERIGLRLLTTLRQSDTIARLGGDEFAILLPATGCDEAIRIAEKIHQQLEKNFIIEGHSLYVGASIGIALYPDHGDNGDLLIQHADIAMYNAKRGNSQYAVYDPEQDSHSPGKLSLIGDLRMALRNGDVQLHYQPQMNLASGAITGVEALLRWTHPQHGNIPPDQIIPLAENTGLIRQLTLHVLDSAISQCCQWRARGIDINVSVNLSALNLQDLELCSDIIAMIRHYDLPWDALTLEITETAFMSNIDKALTILNELHAHGILISVDDYGTGFSSLAYLKRLPVTELKIDRSFIMNMETNDNDAVIVRSTIDLAHNLSLRVVAEGVEDAETLITLNVLGCDAVQGYHIGKPMPADAFEQWLGEHEKRAN